MCAERSLDEVLKKTKQLKKSMSVVAAETYLLDVLKDDFSDIKVFKTLAGLAEEMGEYQRSIDYYSEASIRYPDKPAGLFGQGRVLVHEERFEEAEDVYRNLTKKFPDLPTGYISLGKTLVQLGNIAEAEEVYLKAYALFADNESVYTGLGQLYMLQRRFDLSLEIFSEMRRVFAKIPASFIGQASALLHLGRFREAKKVFKQAKRKFPNDPRGFAGIARVAIKERNFEGALKHFSGVVDRFPDFSSGYKGKAYSLQNLRRFQEAKETLQILAGKRQEFSNRFAVINHLFLYVGGKRCLEIGSDRSIDFCKITASDVEEASVDTFTSNEMTQSLDNSMLSLVESDDFFKVNECTFDLICITRSAIYERLFADLLSSLQVLSPDGLILLYNCFPLKDGKGLSAKQTGAWKLMHDISENYADLECHILDLESGIGVIRKRNRNERDVTGTPNPEIASLKYECSVKEMKEAFDVVSLSELTVRFPLQIGSTGEEVSSNCLISEARLNRALFSRAKRSSLSGEYSIAPPSQGIISGMPSVKTYSNVYSEKGVFGLLNENREIIPASCFHRVNENGAPPPSESDIAVNNAVVDMEHETEEVPVLFLGYLYNHFGHFMLDGLQRAWYLSEHNWDGKVLFYPMRLPPDMKPAQLSAFVHELLGLLGISLEQIVFADKNRRYSSVIIPGEGFRMDAFAYTGHADCFLKIAEEALGQRESSAVSKLKAEKIFLSRTRLSAYSRIVVGEELFEGILADNGFQIIHPQELSVVEQIQIINHADVIVGFPGSALHSLLFCTGKPEVHVFDPGWVAPSYSLIDQIKGIDTRYHDIGKAFHILNDSKMPQCQFPDVLDFQKMLTGLKNAGIIKEGYGVELSSDRIEREYCAFANSINMNNNYYY